MPNSSIDKILSLIIGQMNGDLSPADREELENWIKADPRNRKLAEEISTPEFIPNLLNQWKPGTAGDSLARVKQRIKSAHKVILWPRIATIAASVCIILGIGYYFLSPKTTSGNLEEAAPRLADIKPGTNRATLTLADGRKIKLSGTANGELISEAGLRISKTAEGQLVYTVRGNSAASHKTNTLTTAKGETYMLILPDQSKVWMNAASSLTYSTSLPAHSRRLVTLHGEAYFEVTKDKLRPFIVRTDHQEIQVLGTHFNVSSYKDEPDTKTVLLQGSVQVTSLFGNKETKQLKPGQESLVNDKSIKIHEVDAEDAIAWKNGKFVFVSEDIENIMREISRWYNVEVEYKDELTNRTFSGTMDRTENVSGILRKIEMTNRIHFKVTGRKIIVSK